MEKRSKKLDILIKGIILLIPVLLIGFVVEKNFAILGKRTHSYDFSKDSAFISHLEPWQRLSPVQKEGKTYFQEVKDDAVYFNVQNTKEFKNITVKVTYQNPSTDMIDIGLRVNQKDDYLKLPLESKTINNLDWPSIQNEEFTLFQKNKKFESIDDFYTNYPTESKVIAYNADIKKFVAEDKLKAENITPLRPNANLEGIDYIYTKYSKPETKNGWTTASNTFDYNSAFIDSENNIRFLISTPGLKETEEHLKIENITVSFEQQVTPRKIIKRIREFFNV